MSRGLVFMLQSVVLYTSANLLVKALAVLPTPQLVFLRSAISFALCAVWIWRKGDPLLGHNRKWLVLRGITGMIALTLFFHTIRHIPLASATVIQYLSPIFTVLLAILFDGQRIRPYRWLYFAAAFGGILMVKGFDPRVSWLYLGMGMGSALLAAVAYLATIKCRETDTPVGIVTYFHMIATPVMGSWSAAVWHPMTGSQWVMAIGIGGLSLLAQVAMTKALHLEDAARVMPFKYFGAILALGLAWTLFDEKITGWALVGIAIVLAAVTANAIAGRTKVSVP
jgi:drug/metabolite transporter (DMT)-like permease